MKATKMFWFAWVLASPSTFALPPPQALEDLRSISPTKVVATTDQISAPLQRSLAATFRQKKLKLGNPQDLIGSAVTYTGDPARSAAYRRFIFGFEAGRHAFIYYEKGDPELSACCLIFDVSKPNHPRFLWGGGDLHRPFARSPAELRARIVQGKLWDDKPYIW